MKLQNISVMKILFYFLLLFAFCNCSAANNKNSFKQFRNTFVEIKLPLIINDSLAFKDWNTESLIDTNYIKQYELINQYVSKDYPFKNIQDYKCSYIGRYEIDCCTVLIYKTFTTEAGRGNPEIILATFAEDGKKIDAITALWNDAEDPLYSQRVTLSILNSSNLEIKSVLKNNGILDEKIVSKSVVEKITHYTIGKDCRIIASPEIVKNVYKDDNPKIQDDFPQK